MWYGEGMKKIEDLTDRELDALVGETVMGLRVRKACAAHPFDAEYVAGREWVAFGDYVEESIDEDLPRRLPHYSNDGRPMLDVIDRMASLGKSVAIHHGPQSGDYWVSFCPSVEKGGPSIPRLVCIAALKALGVTEVA